METMNIILKTGVILWLIGVIGLLFDEGQSYMDLPCFLLILWLFRKIGLVIIILSIVIAILFFAK